jgi:hypothetical protein
MARWRRERDNGSSKILRCRSGSEGIGDKNEEKSSGMVAMRKTRK